MGQYRIEITAVGGHGCDRSTKEGERLQGCKRRGCPDCYAAELVEQMRRSGQSIESATFTHWPDTPGEVVDDLLAPARKKGHF